MEQIPGGFFVRPFVGQVQPVRTTQSRIGTSPDYPVVVQIKGADGIAPLLPFIAIFATVAAAFGGAYFAQTLNHRLSKARDDENERRAERRRIRAEFIEKFDDLSKTATRLVRVSDEALIGLGSPDPFAPIRVLLAEMHEMSASILALDARTGPRAEDSIAAWRAARATVGEIYDLVLGRAGMKPGADGATAQRFDELLSMFGVHVEAALEASRRYLESEE